MGYSNLNPHDPKVKGLGRPPSTLFTLNIPVSRNLRLEGSNMKIDIHTLDNNGMAADTGSWNMMPMVIPARFNKGHEFLFSKLLYIFNIYEMYIDFSYCPQPNGHFAHPEFCMLFLNCYNNRAYVQPCAEGLFFNDVIKGCDNPLNVNCGSRWTTKITTTSSTSSTSTHGKQIIKTHDVNYKSKITTETSESGETMIDFSYCPHPLGTFVHPEHCALYLRCRNHKAFVKRCPADTYFSEESSSCEPKQDVVCGHRVTTIIIDVTSDSEIISVAFGSVNIDIICCTLVEEYIRTSGKCVVWGRYHYRTFDGKLYHFQGACTYLLTKDCAENTFSIFLQNSAGCATDSGVCQRKLIILIEPDKFVLQNGINGVEFYHNDALVTIPSSVKGLIVEQMSRKYYMVTHSGLDFRLIWDGELAVIVGTLNFNSRLKGKTCGLCGRYDEDLKNELEIPNGKIAKTVSLFVSSWQEPNLGEHCKDDIIVEHPCEKQNKIIAVEATKVCDILLDVKYKECHDLVAPKPYHESCRMDYCGCQTGVNADCVCSTIQEYFNECNRLDKNIRFSWRSEDFCAVTCQSPTVYVECRSSCPKTCYNDISDCKEETCVDGCECPKGTVLHDGKCIQRADCPCKYNGKEFDSGSYAYKDCNKCICNKGSWECTVQECSSSCSAIGDPHYTTFDGKHYNFMGKCSYYLVKSEDISITQENVPCNGAISEKSGFSPPPKALPSCTKSVTISIKDGTKLHLKQGLEVVTVNDQEITNLPLHAPGMFIYRASSLYIKVELYNGMKILWDGDSRVYITSPPDLQKTTQGLCGNFNHKQNDDFLTPEGDTEIEVNAFANKWKVQSSCDDVGGNPNPCEMFAQRKSAAEKLCNKLFSNVFTDCHDVLSPQSYYEDCMYDLCACEVDIERCLCPELSHYAHECAKRHQVLEWRSQIKECAVQCENGQTYQSCGDSCQASCQAISLSSNCKFDCVDGCNCPVGMTLSNDDECILISACPCIFNKKEYEPGYKQIRQNNLCTCTNALWECHNVTEDITGVDACSATNNMEYVDCKPQCPDLCGDTDNCVKNKYTTCKPGCKCKTGYKFDVKSNKCWKPENCPCSHGGQSYNEGEIMNENCNTCVCEHGKWTCEGNDCSAVCTIWGASNYHTFDGRIFDFYGDCDYILAKGNVDANTAFSISAENVPCGTTGVTCTKSVAMSVGDKKLSLKPDQTDYPVSDTFEVVEKGLFVIVHTNIGISLHWDKKTRVYVKAAPIWKSKIKGLCGNFDDNENNDFRPPNGDIECTKVEDFAESWKIHDYCPVAEQGKAMCEVHSERKNWAYKRCSVLKSDLFSECHSTVPVDEYFNRCVDDTCGCDTGGDCDCLCTAIGIYAHMCNLNGIVINWRSQELCPIQCEHPCDIYNPCLTTCPPITCKNINDSNVRDCQSDVCVEGCEAKACEPGQIFNNLKEMECVPVDECSFNCTLENGDVYRNGERIVDPNQDPCITCHCKKGKIKCIGEPCTTTPPPTTTSSELTTTPETTTTTTTTEQPKLLCGEWSPWFNTYDPILNNGNDYELLKNIRDFEKICQHAFSIECRDSKTLIPHTETGDVFVESCTTSGGLICEASNYKSCNDYEIRVYCECDPPSTTPTPKCVSGWTEFFNEDTPHSDGGDSELMFAISQKYNLCPNGQIIDIRCQANVVGEWTDGNESQKFKIMDWTESGDSDVECNSSIGAVCRNEAQRAGQICSDYEVSFRCLCDGDTTVTTSTASTTSTTESTTSTTARTTTVIIRDIETPNCWTEWVNIDKPSTGGGDYEVMSDIRTRFIFCEKPVEVECRTATTKVASTDTNQVLVCSLREGINCLNADNPKTGCYDYEIRFYCPCETTTEEHITTTPVPETAGPCVQGWTELMNSYKGDSYVDYETVQSARNSGYSFCESEKIIDIQCITLGLQNNQSLKITSLTSAASCDLQNGLICEAVGSQRCEDYAVKYFCQCEPKSTTVSTTVSTTTIGITTVHTAQPPTCNYWSGWINEDSPATGDGDQEKTTYYDLKKKIGFCLEGYVDEIECFSVTSNQYYHQTEEKNVTCSLENGFSCLNSNQHSDWSSSCTSANVFKFISGPNPLPDKNIKSTSSAANFGSNMARLDSGQSWPIYGIETYGVKEKNSWITSYQVWYSLDSIAIKKYRNKHGEVQEFQGNYDATSKVSHNFVPFEAQFVRIVPITWKNRPALRFDLHGCSEYKPTCDEALGLENYLMSDGQITVSSMRYPDLGVSPLRLNSNLDSGPGAWIADSADYNQFIQLDFLTETIIEGIVTQGREDGDEWVTAYRISYSHDGKIWDDIYDESGEFVTFSGNFDSNTTVTNTLKTPIRARFLRIQPVKWMHWISMRLEVIGCFHDFAEGCLQPLGMEDKRIEDSWITASSSKKGCDPQSGRLNNGRSSYKCGGWAVSKSKPNSFIQVDLQRIVNISGVITQGRFGFDQWVTSFRVQYSDDLVSWEAAINPATNTDLIISQRYRIIASKIGINYVPLLKMTGSQQRRITADKIEQLLPQEMLLFNGNFDRNTTVFNYFNPSIFSRYIRIVPHRWHKWIAMRFELLGCNVTNTTTEATSSKIIKATTTTTTATTTTTIPTTIPPLRLCPNVTESWYCPTYCENNLVCDGKDCVDLSDCPCFIEDQRIKVGDTYLTKDCDECICLLGGRTKCSKHSCPPCAKNERAVTSSKCECICEKCQDGTRLCPTSLECIDEDSWCDGIIDCPDDEVNCPTTTTPVTTTTIVTTPTPPDEVWCDISNKMIKTFDGQEYEAQICDHIIFNDKISNSFKVTLHDSCAQSQSKGSLADTDVGIACTKSVSINVDDTEIIIGDDLEVAFNGHTYTASQLVRLSKTRSDIDISVVGDVALFKSLKYKFEVYWDIQTNLHLDITEELLNKVNGACGFYNKNPTDDKQKPNNEQAVNIKDFVDSWSESYGDRTCPSETCPPEVLNSALEICNKLFESPFEDCLSVMNAADRQFYVQGCMSNICKCKLRSTTADINDSPTCIPPLEWHDCGSLCEQRCDNFQDHSCDSKKCIPGCFCPAGLIRKGDKCVKPSECYDQLCTGFGDPHFISFDGSEFTFNGNCSYVLVNSKLKNSPLTIEAISGLCKSGSDQYQNCVTGLQIYYDNHNILIADHKPLHFDNRELEDSEIPLHKNGMHLWIMTEGSTILKIDHINVEVNYFALNHGFRIKLPSSIFKGNVEGLCGNSNFEEKDDLKKMDGKVTTDVAEFASSWITSQFSRDQCLTSSPVQREIETSPNACDNLWGKSACHALFDPSYAVKMCSIDAATKGKSIQTAVCNNLIEYSRRCCEMGVQLDEWMSNFNCTPSCFGGKVYKSCATACPRTCDNFEREVECHIDSVGGCFCPDNLVEKDGLCVKPIRCEVCDDEGHAVGDKWSNGPCTNCECLPGKKKECLVTECASKPICHVGEKLIILNINETDVCCKDFMCSNALSYNQNNNDFYELECDQTKCPAVQWPAVLQKGQVTVIESDGCCNTVNVLCRPEKCGAPPECPEKFTLKAAKGVCCDSHHCEPPPELCLYTHKIDIWEGKEMKIKPENQLQVEYKPGDKWRDGLCKNCECVTTGSVHTPNCIVDLCPTPKDIEHSDVGESWQKENDACTVYKCVSGIKKEIKRIERKIKCDENCPINSRYEKPNSESGVCCGKCVQHSCIENGKVRQIGESWDSETKSCFEGICIKDGDSLEVQYTHFPCPPLHADCPQEHIVTDETGCCKKCEIVPGNCVTSEVNINTTVGIISFKHPDHGLCKNEQPLNMKECSGKCLSHSIFSAAENDFHTLCHCCTANKYESELVSLICYDGVILDHEIQQPVSCSCDSECAGLGAGTGGSGQLERQSVGPAK
ncbi:SCO-spondin [Nymphon striatum]|nr:SCO-spondin [Nymphon striatum]